MSSLPYLRPRKGGQAEHRSLHAGAASPDALPPTRYSATDLDEDLSGGQVSASEKAHGINCNSYALYADERGGMADPA